MEMTKKELEENYHLLAGGAATLSKNKDRFTPFTPQFLETGNGSIVTDVDGYKYIDMIGALGANLLGYNNPRVVDAVIDQVKSGGSFSLINPLEVEVAKKIHDIIPHADKVRFAKNGADVTQAAIRLARWYTHKTDIFCTGYHGMHDWYVCTTPKNGGVLTENRFHTHPLDFLSINKEYLKEKLYKHSANIAAFVVEIPPIEYNTEDPCKIILKDISEFCLDNDIVFVLDEIVTGFRYDLQGAQKYYEIPNVDIICLGKGVANGYPLSIICGKEDIMAGFDDRVFLSTTFGGETIALAAANAVLGFLSGPSFSYRVFTDIGKSIGNILYENIVKYELPIKLLGNHARYILKFENTEVCTGDELKAAWLAFTAINRLLFGGPIFPQYSMYEHIDSISKAINASMERLSSLYNSRDSNEVKKYLHDNNIVVPEDVFAKRY